MIDAMSDSSAASANTIVVTRQGAVQGAAVDGAMRFYDIPYAAPPVGALRFVAPQPHAPWEGVRDATRLGPVAPQPMPTPEEFERAMPGLDITPLVGMGWSGGDDFLALNIWTPNPQAQGLAVMVFIHGGSFTGGAGNAPVYDGAAAKDSDDLEARTAHDIAFHNAIARASHNILFVQIVASFGPLMEVAVPTAWRTRTTSKQRKVMIERHHAVARAIQARDPGAAAAAMAAHFDDSVGDLLKAQAQQ